MTQAIELNDLILAIYDTTVDPSGWPKALDRIARYIGARGAFVFELQGLGKERRIHAPFFSSVYNQDLVDGYLAAHNAQELIDQDVFARLSRPTDQIQLIPDDALANTEEELLARANVRTMLEYGIRYRAGALLNKDQVNQDRFALQFSASAGPLSKAHFERAALLMPHIAKALNISRPTKQLADQFRSVADCIDMLVIGVCILDATGRIVHSNHEFRRQLESYPVFRKDPAGRLVMNAPGSSGALAELRGDLSNHGRFGARPRKEAIVSLVDDKPHTLCVEVAPLTSANEFGEPSLNGHIVYSMDTGSFYEINGDLLASMFQLTQAEASVLEMMAEGLTNLQISERRAKSVETVNSQVKSILVKTRSANRTQLIRLATNISSSFILERPHQNG
ncbi:helix-turn-helix domain-containing protein [Rhizobium sp. G187]|uniref:helix-turn-helix domain-containing protein n=1 Tax=Rhizobium sp. G187 TaxID=3451352 RepID=UPI003EE45344